MQFYKDGFRGGDPDMNNSAPNRRDRGKHAPLPKKVDVLIVGTGPAGLCLYLGRTRPGRAVVTAMVLLRDRSDVSVP